MFAKKGGRDERLKGQTFIITACGGRIFFKIRIMQIRIFNIPITDNGTFIIEMNCFLSANKVLEIEQNFYQNENGAFWSFCVRYITNSHCLPNNKKKIDYREVLDEKTFIVFSKLRECRKIIAANDAVPAYAVFTDKELADIAKLPVLEASKLITIVGIGDKKVEKYGKVLIELFQQKTKNNEAIK
jgi:superfamily II DNA helicase RecQ